jgi:hypothetical protein
MFQTTLRIKRFARPGGWRSRQPRGTRAGTSAGTGSSVIRFHAVANLDRTQFGVTKKKGMVGQNVALTIEAVAVPAGQGGPRQGGSAVSQ